MKPSPDAYRQARAAVVRRLIRDGVLAAERSSPFSTVWDRASGRREDAA